MASKKNNIPIDGIILLNKPLHLSSNQALQKVRRLYCAKKAGHTGSLDPLATGMLPICFGEATKFSQYLFDSEKEYLTTIKLGIKTTTSDSEGEIIETKPVPVLSQDLLIDVLKNFSGEITQIPTIYSAIKHQGKPLYEWARKGVDVEVKSRQITIHDLQLISFDTDTVTLKVQCSKGTYIRTLAQDIGELLQCGAHVISLHRTKVGIFDEHEMLSLETLQQKNIEDLAQLLMPMDIALKHFPKINLDKITAKLLMQGRIIEYSQQHDLVPQLVRVFCEHRFLGLGEINQQWITPKRIVAMEAYEMTMDEFLA